MKVRLITNPDGFVLATIPRKIELSGAGAPARVEPIALHGQTVIEVDVSKDVAALPSADLQRQYRFDRRRNALVKFQARTVQTPAAPPAAKRSSARKAPAKKPE